MFLGVSEHVGPKRRDFTDLLCCFVCPVAFSSDRKGSAQRSDKFINVGLSEWWKGCAAEKYTLAVHSGPMSQKELRTRLEGTVQVQHQQLKMGLLADMWQNMAV